MVSINKVIVAGNLTKDPELKDVGSTKLCNLSIAINENYKKGDEWIESVLYLNDVPVWGKSAEYVAGNMKKGDPVLIEGKLKLNQWEDNSGEKRSKLTVQSIKAHNLQVKYNKDEDDGGTFY